MSKRRFTINISQNQYDALLKAASLEDREVHAWAIRRLFGLDSLPALVPASPPTKPDIFSRAKTKAATQGFDEPEEAP